MIGIVVVTHGRLAAEMVRTLHGVLGEIAQVEAVCTESSVDPDALRTQILSAVMRVEEGQGSLILTDMYGDTATNLSLAISRDRRCEVVAGVNMPMLVKAVTSRNDRELRDLAGFIHAYGRDHIFWASGRRAGRSGG